MINQEIPSRVSRVVWPWRSPVAPPKAKAGPPARCWRAVIQAVVIAGIATLVRCAGHHPRFSVVLYILSAVVLISGLFIPGVFARFEQFGRWLGMAVGIGLTWLLLAPFFYLCVFPGRLFLMLLGKDPMRRRWDRGRPSYWNDRKPADPDFYTRQY